MWSPAYIYSIVVLSLSRINLASFVVINATPYDLYRQISDSALGDLLIAARPSNTPFDYFSVIMDPLQCPFPLFAHIFDHRTAAIDVEAYVAAWIKYESLSHIYIPIWRLREYISDARAKDDLDKGKFKLILKL